MLYATPMVIIKKIPKKYIQNYQKVSLQKKKSSKHKISNEKMKDKKASRQGVPIVAQWK